MISCLSPNIIINPGCYEAVAFSHKVVLNGIVRYLNGVSRLYMRPLYSILKDIISNISQDVLELYFTLDRFGHKVFLFLAVPCRKCILCLQKDENEISQRLQFESECYKDEPYFITLTFGQWSLPKDNNPTIRHIQTYVKRLRNYCYEQYKTNIRFYAQGEHGSKKGRAHIHLLVFGLPTLPHNIADSLFSSAWMTNKFYHHLVNGKVTKSRLPIGNVYVSQINDPNYRNYYEQIKGRPLRPEDGLKYCCKYASKESHCRTWSKGLGKDFAKRFSVDLHYMSQCSVISKDWSLLYRTKYGTSQQVIISRWLLGVCFSQFNRKTYYYRKKIYDYLNYLVACNSDYTYFENTLRDCLSFVGVSLYDLSRKYCQKSFSRLRQKASSKGHEFYLKFISNISNLSFVENIKNIDVDFLKNETLAYYNFCKLYFENRPTLTPGDILVKKVSREKYLNKSLTLNTL